MSQTGKPLPGARIVSLLIYPDVQIEDPKFTLNAMQYGQIITHDMSMIAGSTQARKLKKTTIRSFERNCDHIVTKTILQNPIRLDVVLMTDSCSNLPTFQSTVSPSSCPTMTPLTLKRTLNA